MELIALPEQNAMTTLEKYMFTGLVMNQIPITLAHKLQYAIETEKVITVEHDLWKGTQSAIWGGGGDTISELDNSMSVIPTVVIPLINTSGGCIRLEQ